MYKRCLFSIFVTSLFITSFALLCAGCPGTTSGGTKCGPPSVDAGEDLAGSVGVPVILRGSLNLPPEDEQVCISEKNSVTYHWEQLDGPEDVELSGANQQQASFTPGMAGTYSFRCQATYPVTEVNETTQVSQWDTVNVEIEAAACEAPVAQAGSDRSVATLAGEALELTLDGSASHASSAAGCTDLTLIAHSWTVVSEPGNSSVSITDADQAIATVDLSEFGDYDFQLEVQDSGGTEDGRSDSDTDTVTITLIERSPCEDTLTVKVISDSTGAVLEGVHVTVVDSGGASHNEDTDADGNASFSGLAAGTRLSISAVSDEEVDALPDTGDTTRPRYEVTTVLGHCSNQLTIPLRETKSGQEAPPTGTVIAKIPRTILNMLPHSFKCAADCTTDADCDAIYNGTHYCEQAANECQDQCTPRSLLPFFSMGGGDVSGQMRVAILVPMFPADNFNHFPVGKLFARPPTSDGILPGNLASDDTFLNGLAPSLGLDPWGESCVGIDDCPNTEMGGDCTENSDCPNNNWYCGDNNKCMYKDWICDYDEGLCKDTSPLRNIKMEVPAGGNVRLVLLTGVMNISMIDLLPVLLPFLETEGAEVEFDVGSMLAAFKMRTLHVCPITISVTADQTNDISAALEAISEDDCWNVEYQQMEDVVPLLDPSAIDPDNSCTTNQECDDVKPGYKCLEDPENPGNTYCFMPLYRVTVISGDEVTLQPAATGFDPDDDGADARLCGLLPATAQHEVKCDENDDGLPESCEPDPIFCDIDVSADTTECGLSYGLALTALDFPPGHATIPEGGRAVVGFNFNRTPHGYKNQPRFLVPSLGLAALDGAVMNVTQLFLRNLVTKPDMSYELLPGRVGVSTATDADTSTLQLSEFLELPGHDILPEAGMRVSVSFVPDDPLADCASVNFDQVYATARQMSIPESGSHELPASVTEPAQSDRALHGLVISKVDRVETNGKVQLISDPMWRVYAPSGSATMALPAVVNPFSSGDEVRVTAWASEFEVPFDYDIFSAAQIRTGQSSESEDAFHLMVP